MTHRHFHPAHSHGHAAGDGHHQGPLAPHPAQAAPWSILRMSLAGRLGAAVAVCAVMWLIVALAMRPS